MLWITQVTTIKKRPRKFDTGRQIEVRKTKSCVEQRIRTAF
jgi:hypothetical protein